MKRTIRAVAAMLVVMALASMASPACAANALYDYGRNQFAMAGIKWAASGGDTVKAALVSSSYTPNLASDQFWSTVSPYVVGTPQQIPLSDPVAGVCNGGGVTFSAVTGSQVKYVVIYKDTGTPSTSPLIACLDTATGLPVTPNGGNITITWDSGVNKIFKL